jgi:HEAT repeat protein
VLISDLANHPSELVRTPAARVLGRQAQNPEVRAALERALSDSSTDVRRYASEALAGGGK